MKELKNLIIVLAEAIIGILAIVAVRIFIAWLQRIIPFWVTIVALIGTVSVVVGLNWPRNW